MKTSQTFVRRLEQTMALSPLAAAVALAFSPLPAHTALTDIAAAPLATTSSEVVLPNVMFILDNSGSMDWDFMPDYVSSGLDSVNQNCRPTNTGSTLITCVKGDPPFNSPDFNGIYYNPDIRYVPAIEYDKTSKPSYNNATAWTAVPEDAYGIQSTTNVDILNAFPNHVFCNTGSPTAFDLMPPFTNTTNCRQPIQGGVLTYPTNSHNSRRNPSNVSYAPNSPHYYKITGGVTWCSAKGATNANPFGATSCQTKRTTVGGSPFQYPKYGAGGNNGFTRVDIVEQEKTYATLTIELKTQAVCGEGLGDTCNCTQTGGTFRRIRETVNSVTHNNVVMRGSNLISIGTVGTPATTTNFINNLGTTVCVAVTDTTLHTPLPALISPNPTTTLTTSGATTATLSYPKSAARTDCGGAIGASGCSYTEEMTNFANWFAYYQTRMQMMKTAGGLAFKDISDKYRVGFLTINTGGNPVDSSRFLANSEFTAGATGQRQAWYSKFYAATPSGSTPLREALARAGRYYAGKGPTDTAAGSGINNGMDHDPVQFSCQQNFSILSTDGFWNTGAETVGPVKLDSTTLVGNQDNTLTTSAPRPMFDGTTSTTITTTTLTETQSHCGTSFPSDTCGCTKTGGGSNRNRIREIGNQEEVVTTFDAATGVTKVGAPTLSGPTSGTVGSCSTGALPALQSPNPKVTVTTNSSSSGGPENTLADVAQYYYITDLRGAGSTGGSVIIDGTPTTFDVGTDNNVPGQSSTDVQNDSATHQHMTTFTVSMGLDGTLTYTPDYKTAASGDFASIKSGATNWPIPAAGTQTTVDDLWHAAVNGRGKYFSAKNPTSLASGLAEALSGVNAVVGAAAAAATSNLEPVAGDNFAYIASYETIKWTGEVEARTINLDTGAVSSTPEWKASAQLDAVAFGTRKIWRRKAGEADAGSGTDMQNFTYTNLNATTEQIYFKSPYIHDGVSSTPLAQWTTLDPTTQQPNAQGINLVNYLRGARTNEMSAAGGVDRLFRSREHVLGDIVNAQPVYVKKSSLSYGDAGYDAFKNCLAVGGNPTGCNAITGSELPRPATVFIASNDGMLHAFNGDTGAERWAYIPNQILPNLSRLANTDYGAANNHTYYVDGSPVVGDIHDGTKWRTILVAGLNAGGRGFYALDVTKADAPVALWEFKVRPTASCGDGSAPGTVVLNTSTDDCDLGLAFGNPIISKLGDGTWVVMVTSGYRNVSPGDGKGYLYVLNPVTGVIRKKIAACNATQSICPGSTATDSGLSKINNWVDDTNVNNTTLRVYGADLLGNLWRFNTDGAGSAFVLAKLVDDTAAPGVAQPVTTKPELGDVGGESMIYVATGKYLATADKNTTQRQTIYGIKDDTSGVAPATPLDVRGGTFKPQTLTNTTDALGNQIRTVTNVDPADVTAAGVDGWRVDLPTTGERVNVDMKLQLGTLIIGSNVPATNACTAGGFSFLNFLDYRTGSYISSAAGAVAGQKVGNALLVGINVVRLPNNKTVAIATTSDNQHPTLYPPFQTPKPVGRRVGWRELNE